MATPYQNFDFAAFSGLFNKLATDNELLLKVYLQHNPRPSFILTGLFLSIGDAAQKLAQYLLANPLKLNQTLGEFWHDLMALGQLEMPLDKRFRNDAWEKEPAFIYLRRFYELVTQLLHKLTHDLTGLDKKSQRKIRFYIQQFIDAFAPTNFMTTNPEVIQTTIASGGKNLLDGFENFLNDLLAGRNFLHSQMTDEKAFEVGVNLATTPGSVVFENDLLQLIQYKPTTDKVYATPLLIIPPWINKYYILDLNEKNSLVKWIVARGYTVFMVSWVNPTAAHKNKDFNNYLRDGSLKALDVIKKITKQKEVNVLGFCIGGTLLACTLAYLASKKDNSIKSGTYMTTLLDFSEPGDLGVFIDPNLITWLENHMQEKGYLEGPIMAMAFNLLRANDLIWPYVIKNYLQDKAPIPLDFLYWNSDSANLAYKMHSQYLREFYLHNKLIKKNGITLNNVALDLKKITTPIYFISTMNDHIAPWESTYKGLFLQSGPATFVLGGAGHIVGVVNPPALKKYFYYTNDTCPKSPQEWLETATKHEGSWWTNWEAWLQPKSGKKIPPPPIKELSPAPGAYVKKKSQNQ